MPTPAEQKALAFVALVILLGGAVRIVRAGALAVPPSTPPEQQALARQAFAASSAATVDRQQKGQKGSKSARKEPRRRYTGAKFDSTGLLIEGTGVVPTSGFPPPSPRIDVDVRGRSSGLDPLGTSMTKMGGPGAPAALIDIDVANAGELERLPRIGPALAKRIVANRDSLGPFGSLPALRRVKGVGPAIIEQLAPLVTFSRQMRR
jgi:hypothetical protein